MRNFIKSKWGKLCIAALAVLIVAGAAFGGYQYWLYQQPKFQDVTIELGTTSLGIDQFMTQYAQLGKCRFVSDLSNLNIGKPGVYSLTLGHGKQEQTVTLSVVDTTAPAVVFIPERTEVSGYLPKPEDFVESCTDLSATTVSFAGDVDTQNLGDLNLTVVVTDAYGNATQGICTLSYNWLQENFQLEYGTTLTKEDLLLNPEADNALLDQSQLDSVNASPVGTYTITSTSGSATHACIVTVVDTLGPVLELKTVSVDLNKSAKAEDFIVSVTDPSGVKEVRMLTKLVFDKQGVQTVQFEAEDTCGNITKAEAIFIVSTDIYPPYFEGLSVLQVNKNDKPDYLIGVTATDVKDGPCEIRVDDSGVDTSTAGTYYVTYYATDKSNNTATARRVVQVLNDEADTKTLVAELAATLSSDPEKIRDYVRTAVGYSHEWGGSDPVWFGFKKHHGNCYVHALCLDALLKEKGYQTKLIWTTCKTHYWLVIELDGVWRHIDATPGEEHSFHSLMTDEQRLATLSGRNWDRTQWPACE